MFLESMAYIYLTAVISKDAELKFPTNLLMSDMVAFFNNEKPSVNGVNLTSNDWYLFFVLDHCYYLFRYYLSSWSQVKLPKE
ncbi:hypothetical protein Bca101_057666 [Brassica carinata]